MNDHFVSQQLKKLRQIQPATDWVDQQRQVIMAQVYNGQTPTDQFSYWSNLWLSFKYAFSQPGVVVSAILTIVLLGGGTTSYLAGRHAKPGDSLYIAKQINERAKLLVVSFDRDEQNRLKLAMASQRVTDMSGVDPVTNQKQAEAISREFKQAVSEVKNQLVKAETKAAAQAVIKATKSETELAATTSTEPTFSVATGRDRDDRIEINEPIEATLTPRQIIEEAEQLFDKQDYSATIDKLQAASELLESSK